MRRATLVPIIIITVVAGGCPGTRTATVPAVHLEVRPAFDQPAEGLTPKVDRKSGQTIYLSDDVLLTNGDVERAAVTRNGPAGWAVSLTLTDEASDRFAERTGTMIGQKAALLLDGEVVSAPTVQSRISQHVQIVGDFAEDEAKRIAAGLEGATGG